MEELLRIATPAQTILEKVEAIFQANDVALPSVRYLAIGGAGSTAHDCEQVTVSLGTVAEGYLGSSIRPELNPCTDGYTANFVVEVVRCYPTTGETRRGYANPSTPTPDEMTAYAVTRMTDVWLLVRAAQAIGSTTIPNKALYGIAFSQPNGGMQAVALTINMAV